LASSAFSRFLVFSRSCRSQTERTPKGEIESPFFLNAFETRTCPPGRLIDGKLHNGFFDLWRHPVGEDLLAGSSPPALDRGLSRKSP
jgi:hypothetical protein